MLKKTLIPDVFKNDTDISYLIPMNVVWFKVAYCVWPQLAQWCTPYGAQVIWRHLFDWQGAEMERIRSLTRRLSKLQFQNKSKHTCYLINLVLSKCYNNMKY